jgi:hypothetical protein
MTSFAEQLKTLSVPELEKLERILLLLAHDANHGFDQLLAQIGPTESALSQSDADLIGSRTYELEIYNHLDAASAHKQAMQEFEAGKLHHLEAGKFHHQPKRSIPRRALREPKPNARAEGVGNVAAALGPVPPTAPKDAPATPARAAPPVAIETLPDNVVPFRCYSKFFHNGRDENSVW